MSFKLNFRLARVDLSGLTWGYLISVVFSNYGSSLLRSLLTDAVTAC